MNKGIQSLFFSHQSDILSFYSFDEHTAGLFPIFVHTNATRNQYTAWSEAVQLVKLYIRYMSNLQIFEIIKMFTRKREIHKISNYTFIYKNVNNSKF